MAKDKRLFFDRADRLDLDECAVLHQALVARSIDCPDDVVTIEDIWMKLQRTGVLPAKVKTPSLPRAR